MITIRSTRKLFQAAYPGARPDFALIHRALLQYAMSGIMYDIMKCDV